MKFDARKLPIGTTFTLGQREWRLKRTRPVTPTPTRPTPLEYYFWCDVSGREFRFSPEEIQELYDLGVEFRVPMVFAKEPEPDRPLTRKLMEMYRDRTQGLYGNAVILSAGERIEVSEVREILKEWSL